MILVGDVPSPANPPSGCRFHTRCWLRRELENPERCVNEEPALRELLPGHTVACHFAEEWSPRTAARSWWAEAAEATTGRTVAPEEDLVAPSAAGADCRRQHLRPGKPRRIRTISIG